MKNFITDFTINLDAIDQHGKVDFVLPRYAVWGDMGRGKAEVIETSDDLGALQSKYGPDLTVVELKVK